MHLEKKYISAIFYFLSAILNFVGPFGFCRPFSYSVGKWLTNRNLTLLVQIALLFCLLFQNILFSNFIMQSLSIEFPPKSRQAGDNRKFYCTIIEPPRCYVLYNEFFTRRAQVSFFLASEARFFEILQF